MIMNYALKSSRMRAAEALEALLHQTSAIQLKKMELGLAGREHEIDISARIEVLGRDHILYCQVADGGEEREVREALERLRASAAHRGERAIPVVVVPRLTQETRALCREYMAGCLDLQGNGSLALGEIFISVRSTACRSSEEDSAAPTRPMAARTGIGVPKGFSPDRVDYPAAAMVAQARAH